VSGRVYGAGCVPERSFPSSGLTSVL